MADPEKPPPTYAESTTPTQTQSAGTVTINVSYVKSPRGILKIVEIVSNTVSKQPVMEDI
jgi:hypothetical protein